MEPKNPNLKTVIDEVALEIEALFRDMRAEWQTLQLGYRISTLSALTLLVGTLLPWISIGHLPTEIGLTSGGILHVHLALATLILQQKMLHGKRHMDSLKSVLESQIFLERRYSLWLILIGATSTLIAIGILFYFSSIASDASQIADIRYGFYISLGSGVCISAGGVLQFFNPCPKQPYD